MCRFIIISLIFWTFVNPVRNSVPVLGIIGGDQAKTGQFRYMLNLQSYGEHICGAVLISSKIALTAAHCTHDEPPEYLSVIGGTVRLLDKGINISIERYEEHPKFTSWPLNNDISILFLRKEFKLDSTIGIIALPTRKDFIPVGALATVSGWGIFEESITDEGDDAENLKFANVPIWPKYKCRAYAELHDRLASQSYCAGNDSGKENACAGDSGGPLIYKNKLIGLVSDGFGCGTANYPVIYTKVAKFRNWITKRTGI